MTKPLERLREAGRKLSRANQEKLSSAMSHMRDATAHSEAAHGHIADLVEGMDASAGPNVAGAPTANDLMVGEAARSYQQLIDLVQDAARAKFQNDDDYSRWCYVCVNDLYNDYVVVSVDGDLYSCPWRIGEDGEAELGEPTPVSVTYTATTNMSGDGDQDGDDGVMAEPGVPHQESQRVTTTGAVELLEKQYSDEERQALADKGHAMPSGSYPIVSKADLENAVRSFGRAKDKDAVKAHITQRAKDLKATDLLPADWAGSTKDAKESAAIDLTGELIPLVESAVKADGTVKLKVIQSGWGSSGFYPAAVLERDGPAAFPAGTHMYLDHPTESEARDRPERSLRDLVAITTTPATWDDRGPDGPGLYAEASVTSDYRATVAELAPHIGVSIRAHGLADRGEAEGRTGAIIEAITQGESIDFVTRPGAGGKVLELFEAARTRHPASEAERTAPPAAKETPSVSDVALQEQLSKLREELVIERGQAMVAESLSRIALPQITKQRLAKTLMTQVPTTAEGTLDRTAFAEAIKTEIEQATAEFNEAIGQGRVLGMGSVGTLGAPEPKPEEQEARLKEVFSGLLGDPALGETAAKGRR